jgi:hypothetical protein
LMSYGAALLFWSSNSRRTSASTSSAAETVEAKHKTHECEASFNAQRMQQQPEGHACEHAPLAAISSTAALCCTSCMSVVCIGLGRKLTLKRAYCPSRLSLRVLLTSASGRLCFWWCCLSCCYCCCCHCWTMHVPEAHVYKRHILCKIPRIFAIAMPTRRQ